MSKDSSKSGNYNHRPDFGHPLLVIASLAFIFIFSQVIAFITVQFVLSAAAGQAAPPVINETAAGQFLFIFLAQAVALSLVYWILKHRRLGRDSIGLGRRPKWSDLGRAVQGFLIFFGLVILVTLLTRLIPGLDLDQPQNVGFDSLVSPLDQVMALVSLVIFASIGEEILVRGYLYSGLRSKMKLVPAALLTSLVFGAAHLQPGGGVLVWGAALNTFILSLILVYLREKTGVLYAGMLLHSANNFLAYLVYFHAGVF